MFTGLIEDVGTVKSTEGSGGTRVLAIEAPRTVDQLSQGDSVAVNGVCLTATTIHGATFEAQVVAETLARTTLGSLSPSDVVNLELPLAAMGRFGGHVVQGHVDGVAVVESVPSEDGGLLTLKASKELMRYTVERGSVALDGVSLTVAGCEDLGFSVALIPHTLSATTLGRLRPGDRVNVELDIFAKYVEKMLGGRT
ncbi:MAG: riboflavin synthase [Acidimicrobiia bacterium]